MDSIIVFIIVVLAILLVGIVLIQKSKGGGLAAGFQSSNQLMGAPKTANFLEKATWTIMGVIALLCIISTKIQSNTVAEENETFSAAVSNEATSVPENSDSEVSVPAVEEESAE